MGVKDKLKDLVNKARKRTEVTTEAIDRMKKTAEAIRKAARETKT